MPVPRSAAAGLSLCRISTYVLSRIERWCEDVASVATRKLQRLTWAMCLLAVGLAMSIACLLELMGFDK